MVEFKAFPKMSRFNREVVATEKLDGTNAQVYIGEEGELLCGSRTRWLTLENDNAGFYRWALEHKEELLQLGPGHHYGEWWGQGIQRGYGLKEKRFSLFNVDRWVVDGCPPCCSVVPVLWRGEFEDLALWLIMETLSKTGSLAAPGFMKPEGVVIYHTAGRVGFKKTFEKDTKGKEGRG